MCPQLLIRSTAACLNSFEYFCLPTRGSFPAQCVTSNCFTLGGQSIPRVLDPFLCASPSAARQPSAERNGKHCVLPPGSARKAPTPPSANSALGGGPGLAPPGANTCAALATCLAQNRRVASSWLRAGTVVWVRVVVAHVRPTEGRTLRQAQGRLWGTRHPMDRNVPRLRIAAGGVIIESPIVASVAVRSFALAPDRPNLCPR